MISGWIWRLCGKGGIKFIRAEHHIAIKQCVKPLENLKLRMHYMTKKNSN
jgi:hypothetical protein